MRRQRLTLILVCATLLASCRDVQDPTAVEEPSFAAAAASAPALLVPVTAGGETQQIWPYTGVNFSGAPQDPINLIFVGQSDPRSIRAALFTLNGDRTAFGMPPDFPFNCTWKDAIGSLQTAYAESAAWEGSVIQLECGDYVPVRFHIRLFAAGPWTLANAHLDVLIPGTADHQVLTWELAEQLVTVDFLRSGLLAAPPAQTGQINAAPFREIPAVIYNGLPPQLRQLTGGPLTNVAAPVPLQTDGRATILNLGRHVPLTPGTAAQSFVIHYNQVIPKPFCNPGNAWVLVQGPVELRQEVRMASSGVLASETFLSGELSVTPVDPQTRSPLGHPLRARVREDYETWMSNDDAFISSSRLQLIKAPDARAERLEVELKVGPHERTRFRSREHCWH